METYDLKGESSETLIEYIQMREDPDYAEASKEAFRIFTYRFQLDLLKKTTQVCKNWGYDEQVADEIAHNTFDRVWKYPTYNKTKSKQKDSEKGIIFYLYGIAAHLLADYRKLEEEGEGPFKGDEEIVREFPDIEEMNIEIERKAILVERYEYIKKALERLTPKHKIIYLTYKQYETEINQGYKLPRKLLQKLRTELDLTQSTVRVYKNEAFNEVETYLKIYGSK